MKDLLQKKWLVLLIVFTLISLLITFVLRIITPQETIVPKTKFITTTTADGSVAFNNIRFVGTFTPSINSLPLATIQPSQTTLDYVKEQLIETYELNQVVGFSSLWRGEAYTLSYDEHIDQFLFYKNVVPKNTLIQEPNRTIKSAENFVSTTFPNLALTPQKEKITYFQGLEELTETTALNATAVEIPFTYAIEGIPVYLAHDRTMPITVIVNSTYEIQKVVFQPDFVDVIPAKQKTNLIDLGTALENINNHNEASIIAAFEKETGIFTLDEVVEGTLNTAQLEYRADLETGVVYPFYHFAGTVINQTNQTIQAEIITPAIKTK